MATLNRFPLFGLWTKVAAEALGFEENEAKCIGHGYAVLYAIRAQGGGRVPKKPKHPKEAAALPVGKKDEPLTNSELGFGGDSLPCEMDDDDRVLKCLVGCQSPKDSAQTPKSYDFNIRSKFKDDMYTQLEDKMRELMSHYDKMEIAGRWIYRTYDDWKKACKAGRRVDLEGLLEWLDERIQQKEAA